MKVTKSDYRDIFSGGEFTPTLGDDGTISLPLTLGNAGFNKPDAKFMSAMIRVSFEGKELSLNQIEAVRKRFYKRSSKKTFL